MRIVLLGLTLASAPLAPAAMAQDRPAPAPMRADDGAQRQVTGRTGMRMGGPGMGGLMAADADHDGIVTRDEAIAAADARFDALDTNHDNQVTADEMAAAMPPRRAGRMAGGDAGTRPAMTREDFRLRAGRQFDRLDADHNGRIDAAEIANYREAMRERRERRDGGAPAAMAPAAPPPQ